MLKWIKKAYRFMTERCLKCGKRKISFPLKQTDCILMKDILWCPVCDRKER